MVGILRPLLAVALHVRFGHIDTEVGGQVFEGIAFQLGHRVGRDGDALQALTAHEGLHADVLQRVGQRDALQGAAVLEVVVQTGDAREQAELVERPQVLVAVEDVAVALLVGSVGVGRLRAGESAPLRGEIKPTLYQTGQHCVVLERCGDGLSPFHDGRVVGILSQLRVLHRDAADGSLPRVARLRGGKLVGVEHQLVDALEVLQQVAGVLRGLVAHEDAFQVRGVLEGVLANLRHRGGQDEGLQGGAVVEHILAHPVVFL